jgi:hypothetical protein
MKTSRTNYLLGRHLQPTQYQNRNLLLGMSSECSILYTSTCPPSRIAQQSKKLRRPPSSHPFLDSASRGGFAPRTKSQTKRASTIKGKFRLKVDQRSATNISIQQLVSPGSMALTGPGGAICLTGVVSWTIRGLDGRPQGPLNFSQMVVFFSVFVLALLCVSAFIILCVSALVSS